MVPAPATSYAGAPSGTSQSSVHSDAVTLVDGTSFCLSDLSGDMFPHYSHGVFYHDTRILSHWELHLDGERPESLSVQEITPFRSTFIGRGATRPGYAEPTLLVERQRTVHDGMQEQIRIRNFGAEAVGLHVTIDVNADFADLFMVKEHRPGAPAAVHHRFDGDRLTLSVEHAGQDRGVAIRAKGAQAFSGGFAWRVAVPPNGGQWTADIEVVPSKASRDAHSAFPLSEGSLDPLNNRWQRWREQMPTFHAQWPALQRILERSVEDLGSLLVGDPRDTERDIIAAGAPWFMTLFGRDSLLTSELVLPLDVDLAGGVLHALADLQGKRDDLLSEEQPGRIIHEVRRGLDERVNLGGSHYYYGTVDATPLFVGLLGRAAAWGLPREDILALLPAADRALEWITTRGDRDGDGFVEYQRSTDRGLLNQGWKDSHDSIAFRDGTLARGPIALAEVQGYVYDAFLARADLADLFDDEPTAAHWRERARILKKRFNESYWFPDREYFALALDGDKRRVDSLASNQGHCLWSGIVDDDLAPAVVRALTGPSMSSGWGIRTLAHDTASYNPVSYHNGSVWPHDNALAIMGLCRYGYTDEAGRIAEDLLDAASLFDARPPELFSGISREEFAWPVPYPTSCSPQAWASAAPLGILFALLGLRPDPHAKKLHVSSAVPERWGRIRIENLRFAGSSMTIDTGA